MQFSKLSRYWQKLEKTPSRNKMTEILADLLKETEAEEIDQVCYLSLGRLGPLYEAVEFSLAEKMIIKGIAQTYGFDNRQVIKEYQEKGDLGIVIEKMATDDLKSKNDQLTVNQVYEKLHNIAQEGGAGSQERKLNLMTELLRLLDPVSVKYIVRIPLGRMRLGFSDKTILDALSFMSQGDKSAKKRLEEVYNIHPDVGWLACIVKKEGIERVQKFNNPEVGVPILMAKAQRMSSAAEILDKIGQCAIEPKIDGFRLQIHLIKGHLIKLFTRNLEEVTYMYPDIVKAIKEEVEAETMILEGEAVAYNPQTGEFLPFQETVQRKRKYEIEKYANNVPLKLIAFELLYLNGESLLSKSYTQRRQKLEKIIKKGSQTILLAQKELVEDQKKLEELFDDAVSRGLEGVMAKRLDAGYQAGARNWNWIKYKRSYSASLSDTIDGVILGYDYGKGKRTVFGMGGFLVGIYDDREDLFRTVSKVGTGLTDKQWKELKLETGNWKLGEKPKNYEVNKNLAVDVWVEPTIVVEIEADEITKSPMHSAGLALRFPRLRRFRNDKRPEEATTLEELRQMFKQQRAKKV